MRIFESLSAQIGGLLLMERFLSYEFWISLRSVVQIFNPCVKITFDEFPAEIYGRSEAYAAIQAYLGTNFSGNASRLRASVDGEGRGVALSMSDREEISEAYNGAKVSWSRFTIPPPSKVISFRDGINDEKRAYVLSFRRKHRDIVTRSYLTHVISEGNAIIKRGRRQRLYTNVSGNDDIWISSEKTMWKSVVFEHPATFDTLAMDPNKKKEIMDDLIQFTKAKDYYKRIGKPWKRGYLLHGPPGTGKSTMIAAIANFLHYDVYDLELTAVKDNTTLRKMMMGISKRAIVVIEDINCSLHITGRRRKRNKNGKINMGDSDLLQEKISKAKGDDDKEGSKVTLSGLLNFIDGLWSASGGERIFVFTTNHVDKIDEALIRRGRMDKHIEMSYCSFEAFKALAKNYLNLDSHDNFDKIRCLLSETEISTADVAENLLPTSPDMSAVECLESLIAALQKIKEEGEEKKGEAEVVVEEEEEKMEEGETAEGRENEGVRRFKTRKKREK